MKSIEEIQDLLAKELWDNLEKISSASPLLRYYNEILGDTSYILAGLLGSLLFSPSDEQDVGKWIDDTLITKTKIKGNVLSLWGVVISGLSGVTQQWTWPFYFEVQLNTDNRHFDSFMFLYGQKDDTELPYEEFSKNRGYWDVQFYRTDNWDVSERDWRYIILPGE
jgi:hypothetical protein